MIRMKAYVSSALFGLAIASDSFAADPLQVKEVKEYTLKKGIEGTVDGWVHRRLFLRGKQIGYHNPNAKIYLNVSSTVSMTSG